jgi:hypothetical protein
MIQTVLKANRTSGGGEGVLLEDRDYDHESKRAVPALSNASGQRLSIGIEDDVRVAGSPTVAEIR